MNLIPRSWTHHRHGGHGPEPQRSSGVSRRQVLGATAGLVLGAGLSPSARSAGRQPARRCVAASDSRRRLTRSVS